MFPACNRHILRVKTTKKKATADCTQLRLKGSSRDLYVKLHTDEM